MAVSTRKILLDQAHRYLRLWQEPAGWKSAYCMASRSGHASSPCRRPAAIWLCRKLLRKWHRVTGAHQSMECNFQPVSGPVQGYDGAINTVGSDLGVSEGGGFAWAGFGPATGVPYRALAGEYVGASGGVGGANVLIGGSNRSIALQPVSLEGSLALEIVTGLSQLKLRVARR